MTCLVDDSREVSGIRRGDFALCRGQVDLASAVHYAIETAQLFCVLMENELTISLRQQLTDMNADPTRLAQIIGNPQNLPANPGAGTWCRSR